MRIMIADDSNLIREILVSFFKNNGYEVVVAKNGIEAILLAYKETPDIIVMDVEMPLLAGYQASRLLKSKRGVRDIPIIMHTGLDEERNRFWANASGADDFVAKNLDNLNTLLDNVKSLAGKRSIDKNIIKEDAKGISEEKIHEMLSKVLDFDLFNSTILNMIAESARELGIRNRILSLFKILKNICDYTIASITLLYGKSPISFIYTDISLPQASIDEFNSIAINDFYNTFPQANIANLNKILLNNKLSEDKNFVVQNIKIKSYYFDILKGSGGKAIATIHLTSSVNNYFSDYITSSIKTFIHGAGILLENTIMLEQSIDFAAKIRNAFGKFIPDEVIDDLLEKESKSDIVISEKREVAILFSDIRSFTVISEYNNPEDVVSFLNNYFAIMSRAIRKYGGSVNKFIGDAILAIFGAPKSYEDNSFRCVSAAIEMINSLSEVDIGSLKMPPIGLKIGIGIHEGSVVVGNIGSQDKYDYTVIGDSVNIASRLEGLTKHYKRPILITHSVKDKIADKFKLRLIDRVKVKGKSRSVDIYSLMIYENMPDEAMELYIRGLDMYFIGNWQTAIEYFSKVLEITDDNISQMYINRCNEYLKNPPKEWDGSIALDFK